MPYKGAGTGEVAHNGAEDFITKMFWDETKGYKHFSEREAIRRKMIVSRKKPLVKLFNSTVKVVESKLFYLLLRKE